MYCLWMLQQHNNMNNSTINLVHRLYIHISTMATTAGPVFNAPFHHATYNTHTQPLTHTQQPIVTGTSVLGLKYKDGIMIMADTLGSYGSMAMFKQIERIRKVNNNTVIAAGGEYSDLQEIITQLYLLTTADQLNNDGHVLSSSELFSYLHRWMYQRRSKIDPLWNSIVLGGYDINTEQFLLGAVDIYGTNYTDNHIATGYGAYLALPILRKEYKDNLTADEARTILEKAMTVLLYRDCRTLNNIQISNITKAGVEISTPYKLKTEWEFKRFVNPHDLQ